MEYGAEKVLSKASIKLRALKKRQPVKKNSYCFDILMKLPVFMSCFALLCDVMILHKATGGALLSVFKLRIVPIEDTH